MLPQTPIEFLTEGQRYHRELRARKHSIDLPWYPFDSLSALPVLAEILTPRYTEVVRSIVLKPMLDIGCGDGDLATLFSSFGADVDVIDSSITNFNKMAGVRAQSSQLRNIYDLDLDARFDFPSESYGLTLLLGTLYHLKNPYYLLERLAYHTEWCVISTRVAQLTPRANGAIGDEPVAYLADGREINSDSTNYWIFSGTGLLRILQRTRWSIAAVKRIGCTTGSNPIHPDKDERMFVLVQSRVSHPELQVRTGAGWYASEGNTWCWTAKRFTLEVVLPLETDSREFELDFYVPDAVGSASLTCSIADQTYGYIFAHRPGSYTLRSELPQSALHDPQLTLSFKVQSAFKGDGRELGVCVASPQIPLRVG